MRPKILLVDDREDNLLSIESILEPNGYRFVKANSGRQALKVLLSEFDFSMILMDVKMPDLDGFETAGMIYQREKLRHIPIIFITANDINDENAFKAYQTGAVDYIYKPINPEVLRAKVAVLVDLYRKNILLREQEQKLVSINKNLELEIKERKASEARILDLNRQLLENIAHLEAANKDLDRVAFMASHDLQEPLRKILTFCNLLQVKYKEALDADGLTIIHRIQRGADRMRALISDILTFSTISSKEIELIPSDMNLLVDEVLKEMDEEIKLKRALVKIDRLPCLEVNPGLMKPLFYNLIGNALKYSKKNTAPEIYITAEISPGNLDNNGRYSLKKYSRIIIKDNGIGFEQRYAEEIFGMFKRLHRNNEFDGTGIGLALCKKIVEQHKGFISARSKVNEGSTFIVSLPVPVDELTSL